MTTLREDDLKEIAELLSDCAVVRLNDKAFLVQPKTKESNEHWATRRKQIDGYFAVSQEVLAQPEREWQSLTVDEVKTLWDGVIKYVAGEIRINDFARAIEAKLREKNT